MKHNHANKNDTTRRLMEHAPLQYRKKPTRTAGLWARIRANMVFGTR